MHSQAGGMTTRVVSKNEVDATKKALMEQGYQPLKEQEVEDGKVRITARHSGNPTGRTDIDWKE